MRTHGLALAILTVTLIIGGCQTDTATKPDDGAMISGATATKGLDDPAYFDDLAGQIDNLTWRRFNAQVDLAGDYVEFRPPTWPQDMVFSVRIVPPPECGLVPGTTFQSIAIDLPRWPADADAGPIGDGTQLPVRFWHLPVGDFDVELGLCFAPWQDLAACDNTILVYDLSDARAGLLRFDVFHVTYPIPSNDSPLVVDPSECTTRDDPAIKIVEQKVID